MTTGPGPVRGYSDPVRARLVQRCLGWRGARSPIADRLALILVGTLAWDVVTSGLLRILSFRSTPVVIGLLFAGFWAAALLCIAACRATLWPALSRVNPARLLGAAPVLLAVVAAGTAIQVGEAVAGPTPITNDTTAVTVCAAQDMLRGQNPYQTPELACLHRLGLSPMLSTPLARGPFVHLRRYPTRAQILGAARQAVRGSSAARAFLAHAEYPPLAPVWILPVAWTAQRWRVLWTVGALLLFLIVIGREAGPYWPAGVLIMLLQFGAGSVVNYVMIGGAEVYAYLLAGLAMIWIRHPRRSAVCMVLAVGSNQLAWFLVPGYVILAWGQGRLRQRLAAGTAATLLAVVPLLLIYRGAATASLGLMFSPEFALGLGLVVLRQAGYLPHLSERLLNGTAAVAMVGGAAWGALSTRWRAVSVLVPVAAFWFAWRSEANLLAQVPFFALMLVIGLRREGPPTAIDPGESTGLGCPPAVLPA